MSKPNFIISSVYDNKDRTQHTEMIDVRSREDDDIQKGYKKLAEGLKHETLSVTIELISSGNTSEVPTQEVLNKLMEHLSKFEL